MAHPHDKIGSYTLINKIGSGGFGVVWLAEKRTSIATTRFALKLARNEDVDIEVFKQEAAIWAQVSGHPNVLPIIEADIYDGQIVIVSEYAPGGSLMNWLQKHGGRAPSIGAAVEMAAEILDGLEHLHEQRIIHRDLKPDNILLQRETPRLADFGIARVIKTDSYSKAVTGTFAYMAPEAFNGKRNEQTDVWSVGIILYQMLTGRLPYDQTDIVSLVGAIVGHAPPPLGDFVPESLRRIVMRALERDPTERYRSAAEMRMDLRAVSHELWRPHSVDTLLDFEVTPNTKQEETVPVANTPVGAVSGPPPSLPKVELTPQPLPTVAAQAASITTPQSTITTPLPQVNNLAVAPGRGWLTPGKVIAAIVGAIVVAALVTFAVIKWLPSSASDTQAKTSPGSELPVSFRLNQTLAGHTDSVMPVVFSPDGKILASGSADRSIKLWDVQSGTLKQTLTGHSNGVHSLEFSPDGMTLASGSDDKTIKLWNAQTGALKQTLTGHNSAVHTIAFSPDGNLLASGSTDKTIKIWDVRTGALKQTLTGHAETVKMVAFSPEGKLLASGSDDKTIKVWDVASGALKQTLTGHTNGVHAIAFSPDGKTIASGSIDMTIRLWDAYTGALRQTLTGHSNGVHAIAFSPDGRWLASGSNDKTIKVWDVQSGALKQTLTGHTDSVMAVAFSPDRRTLASGSMDKTIKLWTPES
jgi:WD40 repeat protein/predicted Ser/Thr protein kinase